MANNQQFVVVIDPSGKPRNIPLDKVDLALKSGGRLAKQNAQQPDDQDVAQAAQDNQPEQNQLLQQSDQQGMPNQMMQQPQQQPQQQMQQPVMQQQPAIQQQMIPNVNSIKQHGDGKISKDQLINMLMKGHGDLMSVAQYINERPQLDAIVKGAANFLEPIGNASKGTVVGSIEGIGNAGISAVNLPIEATNVFLKKPMPTIPEINLSKLVPKNSTAGDISYQGSRILGEILGANKAYGATKLIKGLGDETNVAQNIIRGALSGYATGENGLGGRLGSAAAGGIGGPINNLSYKSIADQLVKKMNLEKSISSQGYDKFFRDIPGKNTDLDKVPVFSEKDYKTISKGLPDSERIRIDEFMKNPTIENAHFAKSDIARETRTLRAAYDKNRENFQKTGLLNALERVSSKFDDKMHDSLSKIDPELSDRYRALQFYHARNVAPYEGIGIEKYDKGDKWAKETVKKIMKNRPFMEGYKYNEEFIPGKGQEFRNLKLRKALDSIINKDSAKIGAALGLGGYAFNYFKPEKERDYYGKSGE